MELHAEIGARREGDSRSYRAEDTGSTGDPAPAPPRARLSMRTLALNAVFVLVAFLLLGNFTIAAAWKWADTSAPAAAGPTEMRGVSNFRVVDERLWRGAAPTADGYRALARSGVRTVVDLRAEEDVRPPQDLLAGLGVDLVRIPVRDGQTPTSEEVDRFLAAVRSSDGTVFVHCGAGVGRTGTMAAAYLVETGGSGVREALRRNLSVGPPSLEQLAWVTGLRDGQVGRTNPVLVAVSRTLDAPRRIWSRLNV